MKSTNDSRVHLILGSCPEAIAQIPDQSVDLVFSDPPYAEVSRGYGRLSEDEWLELMKATVTECRRVLRPAGSMVFIMQPNSVKAGRMRTWPWKFTLWGAEQIGLVQDAYWFNTSPIPGGPVNKGFLRSAIKWLVWLGTPDCHHDQTKVLKERFDPGRSRGNERKTSPSGRTRRMDRMYQTSEKRGGATPYNVIQCSAASGSPGSEDHPAVTPLPVADWWCRYLLPEGGVLLDPFVGSGTMLVAGLNNGASRVIGIDKEEEYLGICRRRLALAEAA